MIPSNDWRGPSLGVTSHGRAFLALVEKESKQQRDELPFENVCRQMEVEGLPHQIRIDIAAAASLRLLRGFDQKKEAR